MHLGLIGGIGLDRGFPIVDGAGIQIEDIARRI